MNVPAEVRWDHPRGCGENMYITRTALGFLGITPADAGKTVVGLSYMQRHQDHPRGCGENDVRLRKFDPVPGSPPRMRGKLRDKNACIDL